MAKNSLGTKEAGEALGQVLAKNSVLKELDVSGNYEKSVLTIVNNRKGKEGDIVGFAKGLANGLKANGAVAKFTENELI